MNDNLRFTVIMGRNFSPDHVEWMMSRPTLVIVDPAVTTLTPLSADDLLSITDDLAAGNPPSALESALVNALDGTWLDFPDDVTVPATCADQGHDDYRCRVGTDTTSYVQCSRCERIERA